VLSLVTGKVSYDDTNSRELINQWIDHPQRLWEAVCEILSMGVNTVVHVGPAPNIVPATFERLAANVESQNKGSRRLRALSVAVRRPWLQALLPKRASLLRATMIQQVILEDWLLEQKLDE
jgi:[acyl-carrier-protein] S-malonyltransferase